MQYRVEIVEILKMTVETEAQSAEEAIRQTEEQYSKEQIIVESNRRPDVEFVVYLPAQSF